MLPIARCAAVQALPALCCKIETPAQLPSARQRDNGSILSVLTPEEPCANSILFEYLWKRPSRTEEIDLCSSYHMELRALLAQLRHLRSHNHTKLSRLPIPLKLILKTKEINPFSFHQDRNVSPYSRRRRRLGTRELASLLT